ncbi:vitellogenin-2-like [Pelobates fuscus]|uniref:vitellogenin-2-like n=1 Tax=Pelobates fuscus TaxID=191477 RepID=UPI002FE49B64
MAHKSNRRHRNSGSNNRIHEAGALRHSNQPPNVENSTLEWAARRWRNEAHTHSQRNRKKHIQSRSGQFRTSRKSGRSVSRNSGRSVDRNARCRLRRTCKLSRSRSSKRRRYRAWRRRWIKLRRRYNKRFSSKGQQRCGRSSSSSRSRSDSRSRNRTPPILAGATNSSGKQRKQKRYSRGTRHHSSRESLNKPLLPRSHILKLTKIFHESGKGRSKKPQKYRLS